MAAEQPTRRTAERAAERRRLEAHRQPLDERWRRAVRRWKASYDEVAAILESKPYRFARTMPECPHWYTLWTSWTADGTEDAWTDELDRLWGCVVGHIRIYGVPEQYVAPDGHTWWGTYLYANDWKYWTMGTPVEQTILINRTNQEIDGGPLRRPDRWTLETLGATEMLAHLERRQAARGRKGGTASGAVRRAGSLTERKPWADPRWMKPTGSSCARRPVGARPSRPRNPRRMVM